MAIDSAGAPVERAQFDLVIVGRMGSSSAGILALPGGQFRAQAVAPGDYAIQVEIGSPLQSGRQAGAEIGYLPIRVDNADVEGVVVTTSKLTKVAGRIVFDEGQPDKLADKIRVMAGEFRMASIDDHRWAAPGRALKWARISPSSSRASSGRRRSR